MQIQRAVKYAEGAAQLDHDLNVPGAESLFDQALTNGLAAIVSEQWGEDQVLWENGRAKPASGLLAVIAKEAEEYELNDEPGVYVLPDELLPASPPSGGSPWPWLTELRGCDMPVMETRIKVAILRAALDATQPVRHARGEGHLTREHVEALLDLDDHRSLRCIGSEIQERTSDSDMAADSRSRTRAAARLERIGPHEAARRAAAAPDLHAYESDLCLQLCPVCDNETLSPDYSDSLGMGIGVGECLVCHYHRSHGVAEHEAREIAYAKGWHTRD
ncbi:hypothetical protein ACWCOW_36220 [Streptomyces sp. NPDC001939]